MSVAISSSAEVNNKLNRSSLEYSLFFILLIVLIELIAALTEIGLPAKEFLKKKLIEQLHKRK